MRSSLTTRGGVVVAGASSAKMSGGRVAGSAATRCASCRLSACWWSSTARTGCAARSADQDDSVVAGRGRWLGVRAAVARRDRDADRAEPDLAAGDAELASELFGARLSTGSVEAICQHASTALAGRIRHLRARILCQDALHVDETGWRTAGDSRALWA